MAPPILVDSAARMTDATQYGVQYAIVPVGIAQGGTGATDAATALANLGGVPTSRLIIAGAGLSGGGALTSDVTLTAAASGGGIPVGVNRSILTGNGLTGGGDLSVDRTLLLTLLTLDWDAGSKRVLSGNTGREINAAAFATSGIGTSGSPWSGWDTNTPWAPGTTFLMPEGFYTHAASLDLTAYPGIRIRGEGVGSKITFTGVGPAITAVKGANQFLKNVELSDLWLNGGATCTNLINWSGAIYSSLARIRFSNCTGACLYVEAGVANDLSNLHMSNNEVGGFTTVPTNGIFLTQRASDGVPSTTTAVQSCNVDGMTGSGIKLDHANYVFVTGGYSENNLGGTGRGLELTANASVNTIFCIDLEGNGVEDLLVSGFYNTIQSINSSVSARIAASPGNNNLFIGGQYRNIVVDSGSLRNSFRNVNLTGSFTDNGTGTSWEALYDTNAGTWFPNRYGVGQLVPAVLARQTGIDLNSAVDQPIFTTSPGTIGYIQAVRAYNFSHSATTAVWGYGSAGAPTDWLAPISNAGAIPGKTVASQSGGSAGTPTYPAGTSFVIHVTVPEGVATTCDIEVIGYYYE